MRPLLAAVALGLRLALICPPDYAWAQKSPDPPPPPPASECIGGVTLDNSPDAWECSGTAGDTCVYTCDEGYTDSGSIARLRH